MNATPPPDDLNEELMTRWIDGLLSPAERDSVERALASQPLLGREKEAAQQLGHLLRQHLPASLEPPSPEFFTNRIMEEVRGEPILKTVAPGKVQRGGFRSWLRQPWFGPLASAAVVALLFLASNGSRTGSGSATPSMSRVYAPDPNVVANAFYSEDAGAMVIDLQGLQAVPDDREIRAYDLAEAGPAAPGMPHIFHSANDPDRAVLVLAPDTAHGPQLRELH